MNRADLDDLPDAIVVVAGDGTITAANELAARMLGDQVEALVGQPAAKVLRLRLGDGSDWWECADPLSADARLLPRISEQELTLHTGQRNRPVSLTGRRLAAEDGSVHGLVLALRRAEGRRSRDAARMDLVSTVSHELRSPLTSVKGFTKTLLAKWDRFNDDQKKQMLATVNEDADRVTRLLGELLAVSRIDAGRLQLKRQMVDVTALCQSVVDKIVVASARDIVVDLPQLPKLYVDPDRIEQVFTNLLENAIKYTDGRVTISARRDAESVRFGVADLGGGIPGEELRSIFAKFFRRPGERAAGTGLGLYITKGIVEAHGGECWATSEEGRGSTFYFTIPLGGLELAGIDVSQIPTIPTY